ncbi:hypothetical protein BpHYR1_007257 [Brachionus plicatilis]|uniref:Uncharacterized protein n=1 Tax=Brachionus plicatilis TaxID=10195 RepID=A0A3M7T8J1_BRAPC|nr:hypothetical protein BpHYR1_007257 [Brachionus plicatilis]
MIIPRCRKSKPGYLKPLFRDAWVKNPVLLIRLFLKSWVNKRDFFRIVFLSLNFNTALIFFFKIELGVNDMFLKKLFFWLPSLKV